MNDEKKNFRNQPPRNPNVVYALADYRQLVIQYSTTHAALVKSLIFWKTSALWLSIVTIASIILCIGAYTDNRRQVQGDANTITSINTRVQFLSDRIENWEQELKAARAENEAKDEQIRQLEKNISTASKQQAEKLLKAAETK